MGDLFAVANEAAAFVVDLRSQSPSPTGGSWRVPVTLRPPEDWPMSVNEKLAGMCFGHSALTTEFGNDKLAPRMLHQLIEVAAETRADAKLAALATVLGACDRGQVPNWRVQIGDAVRTT